MEGCSGLQGEGHGRSSPFWPESPASNLVRILASELPARSQKCPGLYNWSQETTENEWGKLPTWRSHDLVAPSLSLHPHCQLLTLLSVSQRNGSNQNFHHSHYSQPLYSQPLCISAPYPAVPSPVTTKRSWLRVRPLPLLLHEVLSLLTCSRTALQQLPPILLHIRFSLPMDHSHQHSNMLGFCLSLKAKTKTKLMAPLSNPISAALLYSLL